MCVKFENVKGRSSRHKHAVDGCQFGQNRDALIMKGLQWLPEDLSTMDRWTHGQMVSDMDNRNNNGESTSPTFIFFHLCSNDQMQDFEDPIENTG